MRELNRDLALWAKRKYKKLRSHLRKAKSIGSRSGIVGAAWLHDGTFCESLGVRFSGATHPEVIGQVQLTVWQPLLPWRPTIFSTAATSNPRSAVYLAAENEVQSPKSILTPLRRRAQQAKKIPRFAEEN